MSEQEWEERWGIAFVSVLIIAVYFALVLFLTFSGSNLSDAKVETVIEHYTYIVVIIIVFYFGFRSVKEYMKLKGKQAKCEEEEKGPEQNKDTQSGACNNKGNMRENQDACLDQKITRIEQKMERASFVDHGYAVGGFATAAGVALLVTWRGIPFTLGPSAIMVLSAAVSLFVFGVLVIRGAHDMGTDLKKNPLVLPQKESFSTNKLLLRAVFKAAIIKAIITLCFSVSIVLLLSLLSLI